MEKRQHDFWFEVYGSADELNEADRSLIVKARAVTANAYAPYSNFNVGAAALLANGEVLTGSNQENASYPVGICAERVLLAAVASLYPHAAVKTMAVSYHYSKGNNSGPISPCGMCRQSLSEYEEHTGQPIRLILSGMSGEVYIINSAGDLLPLSFGKKNLK